MQPSQAQTADGKTDVTSGEFFVPDLCGPRPVFIMIMLAELLVLVHSLASSGLVAFNWDLLAIGSLFAQWVVLLSAALLCLCRGFFARVSLSLAATACLIIILLVTAGSSYLATEPFLQFGTASPFGASGVDVHWWVLRNMAISLILGGIVLRYFYLQQQLQLREQSELQARLDALRARIRPHFLFNTMNSIASLIASQPEAAERAVEDLSELFRASLQESSRTSTVADELRLCELYLGIEQLRLGERLVVEWHVDAELRGEAMPGLILQPLVENAVYHGVAQLPEGGTVVVNVSGAEGFLHAKIENPVPRHATPSQGHHMALGNVEQRLQALFGLEASMDVSRQEGHYCIELSYPMGRLA
jgi:two-component system sensor histidine kinase AlgZ